MVKTPMKYTFMVYSADGKDMVFMKDGAFFEVVTRGGHIH